MISVLSATFFITLAAFTLLWAFSLRLKDAGIVDFYWGPGFVIIASVAWLLSPGADPLANIVLAAVGLWGARLGWHMLRRHDGNEDARYRAMREHHGERFAGKSLWMVFWLQAIIQWLASSPALVAFLATPRPVVALIGLGALLFALGLAIEVQADRELTAFRKFRKDRSVLMTRGLRGRIRYPNYLGEIILQWGIGMMAFGLTLNPLAFVGPALMTWLIIKVSGVAMLDGQLKDRPGFAEWQQSTGALWPKTKSRA
jgi:steroid 5-alpha reductase family enzyme